MKLLFLTLLFGLAFADPDTETAAESNADANADPWYLYGGYGAYPAHYGNYLYPRHYGYSYATYAGYPYATGYRLLGKRSADADPTAVADSKPESDASADPWYGYYGGYGGYAGYGGYYGYGRRYGYGLGYGYPGRYYGYRHIGKRSADADADADAKPTADPYYGFGGYGYARYYRPHYYGYRYAGYPRYGGYYGFYG